MGIALSPKYFLDREIAITGKAPWPMPHRGPGLCSRLVVSGGEEERIRGRVSLGIFFQKKLRLKLGKAAHICNPRVYCAGRDCLKAQGQPKLPSEILSPKT